MTDQALNTAAEEQVTVRPGVVEDVPFIFNSWLKSFREAPTVQGVPNSIYYKEHHDVIERVLSGKGLQVLVVCNKAHPEQIYSYLVATLDTEGVVVHWVYTKHPFRRMGLAKQLWAALQAITATVHKSPSIQYSHRTQAGETLAKSKQLVFNPYKAR